MNPKLLIFDPRADHRRTSLLGAPNIRRAFTANTWVQNHLGMPEFCVLTCVITLPSLLNGVTSGLAVTRPEPEKPGAQSQFRFRSWRVPGSLAPGKLPFHKIRQYHFRVIHSYTFVGWIPCIRIHQSVAWKCKRCDIPNPPEWPNRIS